MPKLVNNKDGESGKRWETFTSYCPNSYSVISDSGEKLGEFTQIKDPDYYGRTTAWVGMGQKFIYLSDARTWVRENVERKHHVR